MFVIKVPTVAYFLSIVGTIGFEMTSYTAEEESGVAEVCIAILEPMDLTNISPRAFVFFFVDTVDGTATGTR